VPLYTKIKQTNKQKKRVLQVQNPKLQTAAFPTNIPYPKTVQTN
jgi:hypothetical protein